MRPLHVLSVLALAFSVPSPARADIIPVAGAVTGQFQNPVPPGCVEELTNDCAPYVYFEGLELGRGVVAFNWGSPGTPATRSQLVFQKTKFSTQTETPFRISSLSFVNLINSAPPKIRVVLDVIVNITASPGDGSNPVVTLRAPLTLDILNGFTDTVVLPATFEPVAASAGGWDFTLTLLGFFRKDAQVSAFTIPSLAATSADLRGVITARRSEPVQ